MDPGNSFDTKGLRFALWLMAVVFCIGAGGKYGLPYAQQYLNASASAASDAAGLFGSVSELARAMYSSTTPQRVISALTIADVVPKVGKFVAADLVHMKLYLYQDGLVTSEYSILTKGRPGSPYETPGGFYTILAKNVDHLNRSAQVRLPYAMQFYGNYFVHGWPSHVDGTPVDPTYSGGCIRLSTEDAEKVFAFADRGTNIFVYDPEHTPMVSPLVLTTTRPPVVSAESYLVADVDTGDVLLEHNASVQRPIASVTKLMTALVANETIMFDKEVPVSAASLKRLGSTTPSTQVEFPVGDLWYPLLMESNNVIAEDLAKYYGTANFLQWMNTTALALDMHSTHYADPSGISRENVSTADDLFRLAVYLTNKKSFIWNISREPSKTLIAESGQAFSFRNFNQFSSSEHFLGGKVGYTEAAKETMVSVFTTTVAGQQRRAAIVVLRSNDFTADTARLADWYLRSAGKPNANVAAACASCTPQPEYRKIEI